MDDDDEHSIDEELDAATLDRIAKNPIIQVIDRAYDEDPPPHVDYDKWLEETGERVWREVKTLMLYGDTPVEEVESACADYDIVFKETKPSGVDHDEWVKSKGQQ